jgi:uncharacterized protein (TIGR00369 family)
VNTETRTYDYDTRPFDPATALAIPGIDYMRGIIRGDFPAPPITATLGFTIVEVDSGHAIFEGTPGRFVYNPIGSVHGGYAATLLDSAMGCAVHTTLPAGKAYTTVDLAVSYVRAITEKSGTLRAEAKVIHTGSSIVTAEGRVVGADGTLYAHGTTTCLVLTPR